MKYRIYIYSKIESLKLLIFIFRFFDAFIFYILLEYFGFLGMHFDVFGVICIINCYVECVYRILCIFLYIGTYFRDSFRYFSTFWEKCRRSVNHFRMKLFL